jgi:hypothetical protein
MLGPSQEYGSGNTEGDININVPKDSRDRNGRPYVVSTGSVDERNNHRGDERRSKPEAACPTGKSPHGWKPRPGPNPLQLRITQQEGYPGYQRPDPLALDWPITSARRFWSWIR